VSWADQLQPFLRAPALYLVGRFPNLHVSSTYRSLDKQAQLYRTWLALRQAGWSNERVCHERGICTPAPPGRSYHNYGRAFDLNGPGADLQRAAALWRSMGGTWFPDDPIHFQA
jgi:LAS superfamily LD-carboxypeptidase LdcB